MSLGGGCEISLHAAARKPHAELYMGLVEVGVGLLPGGGGCKEMLLRAVDSAAVQLAAQVLAKRRFRRNDGSHEEELRDHRHGQGLATSANEARSLGFLSEATRSP